MFKVPVDTLEAYFNFDPARKDDLESLDALIRERAVGLTRYFHKGAPHGEPGMRFKMIGYGPFYYPTKSGALVLWPTIGVALQKNYISLYFALTKVGAPIVDAYLGKLGEWRAGVNNLSFKALSDLNVKALSSLLADAARIYAQDPDNPIRVMTGA